MQMPPCAYANWAGPTVDRWGDGFRNPSPGPWSAHSSLPSAWPKASAGATSSMTLPTFFTANTPGVMRRMHPAATPAGWQWPDGSPPRVHRRQLGRRGQEPGRAAAVGLRRVSHESRAQVHSSLGQPSQLARQFGERKARLPGRCQYPGHVQVRPGPNANRRVPIHSKRETAVAGPGPGNARCPATPGSRTGRHPEN